MNTYTDKHGVSYETRGALDYVFLGDAACICVEMRGDPVGFFSETTPILKVEELEDGWARYWYQNTTPELQETTAELAQLYAEGRAHGWQR